MAPRVVLVVILASVAGATALLRAPLAALIAAFAAVALLIDWIFPVTGFLRVDSRHAFQRLVWQRRREALGQRIRRRHEHNHLEVLAEQLARTAGRRDLGIQPIPLESIIGTVEPEKAVAFDRAFRPPSWSRGRWELMWIACRRGDPMPPISVYHLQGRHFVIDGHHRVSVARSLNATSIDADVIALLPLSDDPAASSAHSGRSVDIGRRATSRRSPTARSPETRPHAIVSGLVLLIIGLGLTLLAGVLGPAAGYVLILVACVFIGRGFGTPDTTGLKDYRQ
jgi:hypothetical protein